jgi:hypothetical protein
MAVRRTMDKRADRAMAERARPEGFNVAVVSSSAAAEDIAGVCRSQPT